MPINIENISKAFSNNCVLKNINLKIEDGSICALMGPNGSGKTTLLKIISTLSLPDSGKITLFGFDAHKNTVRAKEITSFVFDSDKSFYKMLTLRQNLIFFAGLEGLSSSVSKTLLRKLSANFDISRWLDVRASKVSSGIMQRAGLVRGLMKTPKLILIDELSRSLDESSLKTIHAYLKIYVKINNAAILFVTHDAVEADLLADKRMTINDGTVTQFSTTSESGAVQC